MKLTAETTQAQFEAAQVAKRARAALKYANMSGRYAYSGMSVRYTRVRVTKEDVVEVYVLTAGKWFPITINTAIDVR